MTDVERLGVLIEAAIWIPAKRGDHEYSLRKTWADDAAFVWAVEYIRAHGERRKFFKTSYIYFDVNGFCYWSMGAALGATILINRARLVGERCGVPRD